MSIITTEPFVVLLNFIFSAHITSIPQLVLQKVCNAKYNATVCKELGHGGRYKSEQDNVQEASSIWMLILFLATLLPSMFTVLIWGPIADRIGRKRVMLIPPILFGVQSGIYLLNATRFYSSHVGYLVFGAFATSVFGDFQGAYAIACSYMADITERTSKRTMRLAIIEGIMFFSGAPAGLTTGFLLQRFGFGPVFIMTLSLSFLMFIYVAYFLPTPKPVASRKWSHDSSLEDQTAASIKNTENEIEEQQNNSTEEGSTDEDKPLFCKGRRSKTSNSNSIRYYINPLNHLNEIVKVIRGSKSKGLMIALLLCFWLTLIAVSGELYITVLFVKNRPFNLSSEEVGYYFAFISVARGVGAVVVSQIAVRFFDLSDYFIITIGLVSQITNYVLLGLSTSKTMLYLVSLSGIGLGVATSGLRSVITKHVAFDSHGSILAAIEFFDAFGALLANIMSNGIYKWTVSTFAGSAFFVLGSFSATSLFIIGCMKCHHNFAKKKDNNQS